MKILIITQDDPFYLGKNISYLLSNTPAHSKVVGCVVSDVSPFGKKETLIQKAVKTFKIFGPVFFSRYALNFLLAKVNTRYSVTNVLKRHGIPIIEIQGSLNEERSLDLLRSYEPDLLISIAGNEIFKRPLIDLAPKGCLNLHTALLPKYRGLMPSFWVLKNREEESGVSIFFVDEGIDTGPILVQNRYPLAGLSLDQLIKASKQAGMDAIIEAIEKIHNGETALIPNNDDEKTYFGFPTREDVMEFRAAGARFF
ncbi:MAG: formyl transferase [Myxococcales bacterium]|nr:formyl transferase [Myxococcales bacterium]